MGDYAQLEADVYYLAGHKGDFGGALARIEAYEQQADGIDGLRVTFLRAGVVHTSGQLHEALALYNQVYLGSPSDPRLQAACCVEMVVAANHLGDFTIVDQLVSNALRLIEAHPEAADSLERIHVAYAESLYLRGDYAAAVTWYRKSLRQLEDPNGSALKGADRSCGMGIAWYGLAKTYIALGDLVRARFAIQGIHVNGCTRTVKTLEALAEARINIHTGNLSPAEAALAQALTSAPDLELRQEAFMLLGVIHKRRGDHAALSAVLQHFKSCALPKYETQRELNQLLEECCAIGLW